MSYKLRAAGSLQPVGSSREVKVKSESRTRGVSGCSLSQISPALSAASDSSSASCESSYSRCSHADSEWLLSWSLILLLLLPPLPLLLHALHCLLQNTKRHPWTKRHLALPLSPFIHNILTRKPSNLSAKNRQRKSENEASFFGMDFNSSQQSLHFHTKHSHPHSKKTKTNTSS